MMQPYQYNTPYFASSSLTGFNVEEDNKEVLSASYSFDMPFITMFVDESEVEDLFADEIVIEDF